MILLPLLGILAASWLLASGQRENRDTARAVQTDIERLRLVGELRIELGFERMIATSELHMLEVDGGAGDIFQLVVDSGFDLTELREARQDQVDAAIEALGMTNPTNCDDQLAEVCRQLGMLPQLRSELRLEMANPAESAPIVEFTDRYQAVVDAIDDWSIYEIDISRSLAIDHGMFETVNAIDAHTAMIEMITSSDEETALIPTLLNPFVASEGRTNELARLDALYDRAQAVFESNLEGNAAEVWVELRDSAEFSELETNRESFLSSINNNDGSLLTELESTFSQVRGLLDRTDLLHTMVPVAGNQIAIATAAELVESESALRETRLVTYAILGITLLAALIIARSITRPLRRLGQRASQLQAGELHTADPLPPVGPQEVRNASGAVNQLEAVIGQVDEQAAAIAAGQLDHPSLTVAAPGRLGESIQKSVTQMAGAWDQLRIEASHDHLTGLLNRAAGIDAVQELLDESPERPVVGIVVDILRFKSVNQIYGEKIGDEVLQLAANRLRKSFGPDVVLCRFAGDEFLIAMPTTGNTNPLTHAEHALATFAQPFSIGTSRITLDVNVGVAVSEIGQAANDLVADVGLASHAAARANGTSAVVCDGDLRDRAAERAAIEAGLRSAADTGDFTIHLQPIVDGFTQQVRAAEVLLRWSLDGVPIPPDRFIPIAEESGLIIDIDRWVLRQACGLLAYWERERPDLELSLAVNLSAIHLSSDFVVSDIQHVLELSGANPRRLEVEITETMFIDDVDSAVARISAIRSLGVRVSLDDFGTGYSSLSQLQRLPIDKLKVDKAFVGRLDDQNAAEIVEVVCALGRILDLDIVAEGVEEGQHAERLLAMGCQLLQGYWISRPLPVDNFYDWLELWNGGPAALKRHAPLTPPGLAVSTS